MLRAISLTILVVALTACSDASSSTSAPATPATSPIRESLSAYGVVIEYPAGWSSGAPPMPYATCLDCYVVGPPGAMYPYGIQIWVGSHQVGCQLTCYLNIRALAQEATHTIAVAGGKGFRQEFERQRPLGLVNEDGDNTSYREILTVVPMTSTDHVAPEAEVAAVFIDAFYRYGDARAEKEVRDALARMLASIAVDAGMYDPACSQRLRCPEGHP